MHHCGLVSWQRGVAGDMTFVSRKRRTKLVCSWCVPWRVLFVEGLKEQDSSSVLLLNQLIQYAAASGSVCRQPFLLLNRGGFCELLRDPRTAGGCCVYMFERAVSLLNGAGFRASQVSRCIEQCRTSVVFLLAVA